MAATLTIEELYGLFAPSEVPEPFGSFDIFGSAECQTPIGQEKPEGKGDLPPFHNKQHTYRREYKPRSFVRGGKVKAAAPPRERKMVSTVEVNPRYQNVDFASSWAKPKKGESGGKPDAAKPQDAKKESAWGKPAAKPQAAPFSELVAEQEKDDVSLNPGLAWGSSTPQDGDWPSLPGQHAESKPKKSAWGNFKP